MTALASVTEERIREFLRPGDPLLVVARERMWRSFEARRWFEESAARWAVGEFFRRRRRMLCWVPPDLSRPESWPLVDEQWWEKSVAVFSNGSHTDRPTVGVYQGVRPGFLGYSVVIAHFGTWGSTTHIGPGGVYEMFELPEAFTEPPGRYDDDEE